MELRLLFLGTCSSDGVECVKKSLGLPLSVFVRAEEDEVGDEGDEMSLFVKWLPRLEGGGMFQVSCSVMLARFVWQCDEPNELCEA